MKNSIKVIITSILLVCSTGAFAEGVDVVTLTTTAEGKTKDEAVMNALRSAIEQAFGTFISSKTEIVNDHLIRDEIVSVASGNIQKYDVLSTTAIPNGNTVVSVKANVSVAKLTRFSESKGITVEFKGAVFAANIKLQELYKKNELEALKNLETILNEMISSCFDYEISVGDPTKSTQDKWQLCTKITISPNKNLENVQAVLINTLSGLSMTAEEVQSYKERREQVFPICVETKRRIPIEEKGKKKSKKPQEIIQTTIVSVLPFHLRNRESDRKMEEIFGCLAYKKYSCVVHNGLFSTTVNKVSVSDRKHSQSDYRHLKTDRNRIGLDYEPCGCTRGISFSDSYTTGSIEYCSSLSLTDMEKIQKYTVEPLKSK
jgi:hypothetical protein